MNLKSLLRTTPWVLVVVPLVAAGCTLLGSKLPPVEDLAERRSRRKQEAVREFEVHRGIVELEAARVRRAEGDLDGCIDTLNRLLARNPAHLDARLLLAETLLAENRPQQAVKVLEPAVAAHADEPRLQHLMGLLAEAMGQPDVALAWYQQAAKSPLDDDPNAAASHEVVISDEISQKPSALPAESAVSTARLVSSNPSQRSNPNTPAQPATAAQSASRNAARAEAADPVDPDGSPEDPVQTAVADLLDKGRQAVSEGNTDQATAYFWEATSLKPDDPQIPVSAAVSALRYNQPDLAIQLLAPCTDLYTDSAAVPRTLATAYYRKGDYASAQTALEQALSLDKSSPLSYFLMGCTLVKLGQPEAAEIHFRRARVIDPRYAPRP